MKLKILLLILILIIVGCRQNSAADSIDFNIELTVEPTPPTIGTATLVVAVTNIEGQPVDGARVDVRGDMNHPGMQPVLEFATESENGVYRVPFQWTMSGDWIVSVTVSLPDDRQFSETFEFTVES